MPQIHLIETRDKAKKLVLNKLYPIDDPILLLINSHLLIESLLYKFVQTKVENPKDLEGAKLTFHQIRCLAKSLRKRNKEEDWIWGILKELNSIRNALAHNIEVVDLSERINTLIEKGENKINIHWPNADPKEREAKKLNYFMIILCGIVFNLSD